MFRIIFRCEDCRTLNRRREEPVAQEDFDNLTDAVVHIVGSHSRHHVVPVVLEERYEDDY